MAINGLKSGPNYLKFGPEVYLNDFYQILKYFWKILKIGKNLGKKRTFFKIFASNFEKKTLTKSELTYWKNCPIKLKFGQNVARVPLYKFIRALLDILNISQLMGFRIEQIRNFCQKLTENWPKYPFCLILNPIS